MSPARATDGLTHSATIERRERRVLVLVLSLTAPLAIVVLLLLPVGPVFRLYSIPSGSNAPTLPIGSHVVVSRAAYGYSRYSFDGIELPIAGRWPALVPRRGDMIAFRLPRDRKITYVKRVVGLPGERVQMIGGRLFLNGRLVPRAPAPEVRDPFDSRREVEVYVEQLPEGVSYQVIEAEGNRGRFDNTEEFLVPPGHLFVLGDNRDNSIDSREPPTRLGVGYVPIELVIGPVVASF